MQRQLQEIKDLAIKYSKEELGRMVQLGMLEPQKAMMAGMMRDRIAKQDTKPPQTTAAQDVLGLPTLAVGPQNITPQLRSSPGIGTPPAPPLMMEAAEGGLLNLSAGGVGEYAGGGIVAFGDGGDVPGYAGEDESLVRYKPGLFERGFMFPENSFLGAFQRNTLPFQESPAMRSNKELQNIEQRLMDPSISSAERQRLEQGRKVLTERLSQSYPSEGARGAATFTNVSNALPAGDNQQPPPPSVPTAGRRGPSAPAPAQSKSILLDAPTFKPFNPNAIKIAGEFYEGEAPKELADYGRERADYLRSQGVDPNLISKMITDVEGRKGKLEKRKGEAKGEALMMAGLGVMGARRGQEFQALSEAGRSALTAYKQDVKDLRAAEEKYDERIETLRMADQQAKQTGAEKDIARRDAAKDRFEAAKMEKAKAQNDLNKTSALVSSQVFSAETKRDVDLYQTRQSATTSQAQLEMEKYKADLSARVQSAYTNALRLGQLDERRARTLIEAADSFIKNNGDKSVYLNSPQLLQQDAMAYAQRLAEQFMRNAPTGQGPAPQTAPPSNRPPLSSFGR
jgi:hypothetical protein